jgi:hypothetical protein
MDIGSLLLILALVILVGLFVARPLFDRKAEVVAPPSRQSDHQRSALLAEHDRILNALQELDFDHALGKIPEEEYPTQRALLLQQGAEALRQLDELQLQAPTQDAESRMEAAIAARRADAPQAGGELTLGKAGKDGAATQAEAVLGTPVTTAASLDDDIEAQLAARRRARQDRSAGFCPQCGRPIQKSDRFCPRCGKNLS